MANGRRSITFILLFLLLAGLAGAGCREDAEAPTAPGGAPAPALADASTLLTFRQVSAGLDHVCGVTTDDRAFCWGSNQWGQLGIGTTESPDECNTHPCSARPVAVVGGLHFRAVSVGWQFACGRTTDDRLFCWGRDEVGQLGDGGPSANSTVPVEVAGGRHWLQVAAGGGTACGITLSRGAFCWGANDRGQFGNGTTAPSMVPTAVARGLEWAQLTGGFAHNCGITTAQQAWCWGRNDDGRLGDGTKTQRLKPARVTGGLLFAQIEAGVSHTCAVTTGSRVYCWGAGAIGDGTTVTTHLVPTAVRSTRSFVVVTAGSGQSCGVTVAGSGFCWGANGAGQLGEGTTTLRIRPFPLAVDLHLRSVTAGATFSCGVTTGNHAWCWGENFNGEVGDGTDDMRLVPTPVAGPS